MAVDVIRGPIPAGTTVRTATHGRVRVVDGLPAAPAGKRRCWWCCVGRLIVDDDEAEAEHRYAAHPTLADPGRHIREREVDLEDGARADVAWAAAPSASASVTAGLLRRPL